MKKYRDWPGTIGTVASVLFIGLALAVNLAFMGFVAWAIYMLVTHFT